MGRPLKRYVECFPHDVKASRQSSTIEALEMARGASGEPLGNNGYAFWFKLLEMLAGTDSMYIDCSKPDQWLRLISRARMTEQDANICIHTLITMGAIDRECWEGRKIIWCPNLAERILTVLPRRGMAFGPPLPEEQRAAGSVGADIRHRNVTVEETDFGPVEIDHDWARVEESYAEQVGVLPMGQTLDRLMAFYEKMGADIVITAIEYTNGKQADNPKRYLMQVLGNWEKAGVTTVAQAKAQIAEHETKAKRAQQPKHEEQPTQSDGDAVRWVS